MNKTERVPHRAEPVHWAPGLIAPPLFTPDEVAAVAAAIIDVTTKWRWV